MIGQKVGNYEITAKLGEGGMGEVYRARDTRLDRDVALKVLPAEFAADAERLSRFEREAKVLAGLNHTSIGAIYGLEEAKGTRFLVLELAEGETLADRIARGPIPAEEATEIALQVATALETAHEQGVVHRDLKPANIQVSPDGRVKVLDFGLAKAFDTSSADSSVDLSNSPTIAQTSATLAGVILGTAAYMSPEQARGKTVDKRADIFAFGAVFHEMLTGRQLFVGDTVSDILAAVLRHSPDLEDLPKNTPHPIRALVARCLEKDASRRLRDIGDARIIIQDIMSGTIDEPDATRDEPAAKRSSWPLRIAIGVAIIAVAAASMQFFTPKIDTALPLRKFEIPLDREDTSSDVAFAPTISPDGRFILFVSQDRIWVRDLATTVSRPLPGTENARWPFWSPDAEWIGYGSANALMKIDRSGGRSMILANVSGSEAMSNASSGTWNPDGNIFYTTGSTGVLRVSAQAGEVSMHHPPQDNEVDFHEMCRLPGNSGWVLVVHDKESYGQLSLLSPKGERKPLLAYEDDSFANPTWSPTGHLLFERTSVARGIWAVPFSLQSLGVIGEPFLVAAEGRCPSVSDDGTLVYSTGMRQRKLKIAWYDRQGNLLEDIADVETTRPFPYISPDQTTILITANADDGREIWLFDTSNGTERRLTFEGLRWGEASWHPDGRHVLSYTEPEYTNHLITLDGSEPRRELGPGILSHISPDGAELFFSKPLLGQGFDFDIYVKPLDSPSDEGRELVSKTGIQWAPTPSPDGKYLMYVSGESGKQEIYVTSYPGLEGRWQVSRGGGGWARWRGDGKEIFYTTHDEMFSVSVEERNGLVLGRPQKLFDRPKTDWSATWPDGFDVTRDGDRFVMLHQVHDESDQQPVLIVVQNWIEEFAK